MNRFPVIVMAIFMVLPGSGCSDAREVSISFTGDIIMHIPVKSSAQARNKTDGAGKKSINNNGYDFLYERIRPVLKQSDIVVGNMEFPVSPPFQSKPRYFNCPPEGIAAMQWAGFNLVTIGNNHLLDQGNDGVVNTMRYLDRYRMDYIGVGENEARARAGVVKTVHGMRVGFLGYAGYLNFPRPRNAKGFYLNWLYDDDKVKKDIEEMRRKCDYLVMVAHTGIEYNTVPRSSDVELFKKYIDAGVDLVVAHHPHLLQPLEKVMASDGRDCYVFYSLGNFVSNQSTKAEAFFEGAPITTRDSVIVRCVLKSGGKRPAARFELVPVYTINIIEAGTGLRAIQTVSIDREIGELKKRRATADAKEKVDIERQLQNLYQKFKAIRIALFRGKNIKEATISTTSGGYE
ncbi:MAG: CapA family protein [Spirochaetes bacterium]|nr:CapA family protein [Spirochaetota bacterium]